MGSSKQDARRPFISRQQPPVSCHFCRSRKLRCGREHPCSNCLTRGIECQRIQVPRTSWTPAPTPSEPTTASPSKSSSESQLLQRIEVLEQTVALHSARWDQVSAHTDKYQSLPISPVGVTSVPLFMSINSPYPSWRHQASSSQYPQGNGPLSSIFNTYTSWLYESPNREQSGVQPKFGLWIQVMTIQQIYRFDESNNLMHRIAANSISICLLCRPEGQAFIDTYIRDIHNLYHVVDIPTLRFIFKNIYSLLETPNRMPPGQIVLIVSVFAAAAYFWPLPDSKSGAASGLQEAHRTTSFWTETARALINRCIHFDYISLEVVQGIIILLSVVGSLEGPSHKFRGLLNQGLVVAQELKLHISDYENTGEAEDQVQKEIRRRVWWYLATTDWLLAGFNGNHEGTYQVSSRHMVVNAPQHLWDDIEETGFTDQAEGNVRSLSFFLLRLRLAEISRSLVDRSPLSSTSLGVPGYEDVLKIDADLNEFINGLPSQFLLNGTSTNQQRPHSASPTWLTIQKYFINSLAHTHRCKLHLPYLPRSFTGSTFAYSRKTCLSAASSIIQNELELEETGLPFSQTRLRSAGHLNGLFIASMALTVDLCLGGSASLCNLPRRETTEAFRMLTAASKFCASASTLLQSLTKTLHDHEVLCSPLVEPHIQMRDLEHGTVSNLSGDNGLSIEALQLPNTGPQHELLVGSAALNAQSGQQSEKNSANATTTLNEPTRIDLTESYDRLNQNVYTQASLEDTSWSFLVAEMDGSLYK